MKRLVLFATLLLSSVSFTNSDIFWNADNLNNEQECLLKIVRTKMKSTNTSAGPTFKAESTTSLNEFQDAMEKWWGFRPSAYVNVYDANTNTIYLSNTKARYKHPRTPVDSLVHELTHFVQSKDFGAGKDSDEEYLENQAVQVQTWFRETHGSFIQDESYRGPCE